MKPQPGPFYRTLQCSFVLSKILAVLLEIQYGNMSPVTSTSISHDYDYTLVESTSSNEDTTMEEFAPMEDAIDEDDQKKLPLPFDLSEDPSDVHFYLYRDPSNPDASHELDFNDLENFRSSPFDPEAKTVFLIHGFWSNSSSPTPLSIKNAYLRGGFPYNIIVVEWGRLSKPTPSLDVYSPLAYSVVVKRNIPIVYKTVADFIQFLIQLRYTSLDKIHIIGHSLGAHVSGGVGMTLSTYPDNHGRKVARVTGLDPAGPFFQGIRLQRRLHKNDAEFVDVYHTAAGTLGNKIRREGHVDFFPNGGHHQPGCVDEDYPFWENEFGSCSHSFVAKIYASSILKNFTACQCDPMFIDYILGTKCLGDCSVRVFAGEPCPFGARGQFYFETSKDPFSDR